MLSWKKIGFLAIILFSIVSVVTAQEECPTNVDDALSTMSEICFGIGRNQACYGNGEIVAVPQADADLEFTDVGDTAIVDDIQSLTLTPYTVDLEEWGIAVLVLQADIPETLPGQNVTMLVFGDVELTNDAGAYYFTSGIGSPTCNVAPDGLLIQTPEGAGMVNLTINGINIELGSTAYLSTSEEDVLTFALLEGDSTLSIDDEEVTLVTEQFTTIELDDDLNAAGEFTEPETIENLDLPELPVLLLPDAITEDAEMIDGEDDTSSASGEQIIPLDGDWTYTTTDIQVSDDCPPTFASAMQGSLSLGIEDSVENITFNADNVFADISEEFEALAAEGMTVEVDDSDPNVYQLTAAFSDADGSVTLTYTWRILSETMMDGGVTQEIVVPGFGSCTFSVDFTIEHQG